MVTVIRLHDGTWLTSREAADLMGCSVEYLHKMHYMGWLVPVKVGGRTLMYRRVDVERYIETHPRLGRAVNS